MTSPTDRLPAVSATLSVVIPVLDDAESLIVCLAALEAQEVRVDEIIVVDNGCTDDSVAIALAAGARVVVEAIPGIPAAAATGLDAATGSIRARMDADSRPPADWSRRVHAVFEAAPGLAVLTGPGQFYDAGPVLRRFAQTFYMSAYFSSVGMLLGQPPAFGSNFAIRSDVWRAIRDDIHDARDDVHDDMDLSFQLRPGMVTRLDPQLRMGISARPLRSGRGMIKRFSRAFITIGINLRERGFLRRHLERRAWERGDLDAIVEPQNR